MTEAIATVRKVAQGLWAFIIRIVANSVRRLYIFCLYGLIWWQQQGLRRWYRRLGEKIFTLKEAGDLNPLLHEQVKDYLEILRQRRERKQGVYDKIAAVRAGMKKSALAPEEAPEPEPPTQHGTG